jgi:hypothetical protein
MHAILIWQGIIIIIIISNTNAMHNACVHTQNNIVELCPPTRPQQIHETFFYYKDDDLRRLKANRTSNHFMVLIHDKHAGPQVRGNLPKIIKLLEHDKPNKSIPKYLSTARSVPQGCNKKKYNLATRAGQMPINCVKSWYIIVYMASSPRKKELDGMITSMLFSSIFYPDLERNHEPMSSSVFSFPFLDDCDHEHRFITSTSSASRHMVRDGASPINTSPLASTAVGTPSTLT